MSLSSFTHVCTYSGHPRETLQGGTRLLWAPGTGKIVENTEKMRKKINIKRLWLRLWGPSEIHRPLIGSPDPGPMYRLNPPLIGPVNITHLVCV